MELYIFFWWKGNFSFISKNSLLVILSRKLNLFYQEKVLAHRFPNSPTFPIEKFWSQKVRKFVKIVKYLPIFLISKKHPSMLWRCEKLEFSYLLSASPSHFLKHKVLGFLVGKIVNWDLWCHNYSKLGWKLWVPSSNSNRIKHFHFRFHAGIN